MYEELFGTKITYDPIKTNEDDPPDPRLDLTDELDIKSNGPVKPNPWTTIDILYNDIANAQPPAAPEENAFGEDTARAFGAGVAQTGAMGAGGLEYVSRQVRRKMDTGVASEMLDDVTAELAEMRQNMSGQAQEWLQ